MGRSNSDIKNEGCSTDPEHLILQIRLYGKDRRSGTFSHDVFGDNPGRRSKNGAIWRC